MRLHRPMGFLFMWSLVLLASSAQAREPEGIFPEIRETFDPKELAPILENATVVIFHEEEGRPTFLTGILLIHAPFEKVWSVVTDYPKYSEFVPNVVHIKVLERHPDQRSQDSEYMTGFKAGPIELGIVWTLEQHLEKDEHTIWARPAARGEQAFTEVNYREVYFPVDESRTIMTYTNYANLASFGRLAKLVFQAFPELQVPTLVSVGTLFPESIKERCEGSRIIVEPKNIPHDQVRVPPPLENGGALEGLLKRFKKIVLSRYPDSSGIRFFTSLALVDAPPDRARTVVTDFKNYPAVFKVIERARKLRGDAKAFTVEFLAKYKIVLPLTFEYTLDYLWNDEQTRLSYSLNRLREHTVEGDWGAWDFQELDGKTLLSYTSFTDLRSGGFLLKALMDNIAGFGTGFRVGMSSMQMQAVVKAVTEKESIRFSSAGF